MVVVRTPSGPPSDGSVEEAHDSRLTQSAEAVPRTALVEPVHRSASRQSPGSDTSVRHCPCKPPHRLQRPTAMSEATFSPLVRFGPPPGPMKAGKAKSTSVSIQRRLLLASASASSVSISTRASCSFVPWAMFDVLPASHDRAAHPVSQPDLRGL